MICEREHQISANKDYSSIIIEVIRTVFIIIIFIL